MQLANVEARFSLLSHFANVLEERLVVGAVAEEVAKVAEGSLCCVRDGLLLDL